MKEKVINVQERETKVIPRLPSVVRSVVHRKSAYISSQTTETAGQALENLTS